jgi:EAL domain-containing protein (putative c-di-GMP-specific phosphodiesterase class I)
MHKLFLKDPTLDDRVTFEMLESEAIIDYDSIERFITKVKRKGAKIAIDDFGSGYSNFAHILNLDVDYIKIDGSLIKNIDKDKNSFKIVKLLVQFAKESNIKTVAEFIENEKILNIVKDLGVDYGQGYYLGKPSPELITKILHI